MSLTHLYREIEALGGAPIMDDYDEGYTDGLDEALAILRKYGFGVDLAPAPQWQPIESAPTDWTDIILFDPEREQHVFQGYFSMRDGGHDCWVEDQGMGSEQVFPTHWMPLPEPPTSDIS